MCDSAGRMWREGHSGEHVGSLLSASPVFWGGGGALYLSLTQVEHVLILWITRM